MDVAIQELPFSEPIRRNIGNHALDLSPLNLITHRPHARPEDILLVASRFDLFVPLATVEALSCAWGNTALWTCDHGHISVLLSVPVMERTIRWLQGRAAAAGANG
jgi:predicted alpha/beta hydrolase family esterase